jgi:ABC-2 type transport system ATP-binding protein
MYEEEVHRTDTATNPSGVSARDLGKRFGDMWALRHLDLEVPAGTVLGLLGHNGAGKTTAIRILTTLTKPTTGAASVAGFDVTRQPGQVRARIGVAAQQATVDGLLTARANLMMLGRLHRLPAAVARRRGDELLERIGLADVADHLVRTYSGGMRRRLDLAATLVARPQVLFLDEPTTGLDPQSRNDLWDLLRELVRDGTTLVLTTQYLEEADRLADEVVVLDHGLVAAAGTPDELKSRIGGDRIVVSVAEASALEPAARAVAPFSTAAPWIEADTFNVVAPVSEGIRLIDVVRALDADGVDAIDVARRQATLDDVFLTITNRSTALPEGAPA